MTLKRPKSGNMCMYMQVRTNSFEDDGMVVFVGYSAGRRAFDALRGLLTRGGGDEMERTSLENRRLMEELLGCGEGSS